MIDADDIARKLLEKDTPEYHNVVSSFGESILRSNGEIDRKALATKVFSSSNDLKTLEDIVHPSVQQQIKARLAEARDSNWKFAVIDIPLLKKGGLEPEIDITILVTAEQGKIIERAVSDGMDKGHALERLSSQPSLEELERAADAKIENNGNLDDLRHKIDELFKSRLQQLIS